MLQKEEADCSTKGLHNNELSWIKLTLRAAVATRVGEQKLLVSPTVPQAQLAATIAICAHNEETNIGRLLTRLSDYAGIDLEMIVVSSSIDATDSIVKSLALADRRIRLIKELQRMGKANALSLAISHAKGAVLIFLDADTLPLPGAISNILERFSLDEHVGVLTGSVEAMNPDDRLVSSASKLLREAHNELCLLLSRLGKPPKVNGTFFAVRRGIVENIPFDTVSDDEFVVYCALAKGYHVDYVPKAIVGVVDPFLVSDYLRRRVRILSGHFWLEKKCGYKVPTTSVVLGIRSLLQAVKNHPSYLRALPLALILEVFSRALAIATVWRGQVPYVYRIDNTKLLLSSA